MKDHQRLTLENLGWGRDVVPAGIVHRSIRYHKKIDVFLCLDYCIDQSDITRRLVHFYVLIIVFHSCKSATIIKVCYGLSNVKYFSSLCQSILINLS